MSAGGSHPNILTLGYAFFQTANNVAVMGAAAAGQQGVVSGMLNLSRNLGLICGASGIGAVYAAFASPDVPIVPADAAAAGMRYTFAVAALLALLALGFVSGRLLASRQQHGGT